MSEEKTDNELIAEFMDGTTFDGSGLCTDPEKKYSWRPGCYDPLRVEHLAYDKSWGWLMPVVEKIHKLWEQYPIVDWQNDKEMFHFTEVVAIPVSEKIEVVYKAVVEFIKWYQKQQNG